MAIKWHKLGIIKGNNLKDNTKLYRYISLSQFLSFVETKKTVLNNIISWEDTWEVPAGKIPRQTTDGKIEFPLWSIHKDMFGQCWSLEGSSDALWRIYSPFKEGILLQTSVKKFELMGHRIKFGMLAPVIYYDNLIQALNDTKTVKFPAKVFIDGFLKRRVFEHEKEVRLVIINDERCLKERSKNTKFIEIDLNPIDFIEGLQIDPRASDQYVNTIQKYCKRAGFTIVPKKSDLYSDVYENTGIVIQYITKE